MSGLTVAPGGNEFRYSREFRVLTSTAAQRWPRSCTAIESSQSRSGRTAHLQLRDLFAAPDPPTFLQQAPTGRAPRRAGLEALAADRAQLRAVVRGADTPDRARARAHHERLCARAPRTRIANALQHVAIG